MDERTLELPMFRLPTQRESETALADAQRLWRRHLAAWASDSLRVRASGLAEMRWSRQDDFETFYQIAA